MAWRLTPTRGIVNTREPVSAACSSPGAYTKFEQEYSHIISTFVVDANPDEVVLTFSDNYCLTDGTLKGKDMASLLEGEWVNDTIIATYQHFLTMRDDVMLLKGMKETQALFLTPTFFPVGRCATEAY